MRKINICLLFIITNFFPTLIVSQIIFSPLPPDPNISPGELMIINQTKYWREYYHGPPAYKLIVKIIPVGALFTGDDRYSPKGNTTVAPPYYEDITGGIFELDTINDALVNPPRRREIKINLDDSNTTSRPSLQLNIGLSLYKIELWNSDTTELLNYLYIDYRDSEFRNSLIIDTVD